MRRFLQRNLGLKMISLILAYATWWLVVARPPVVRQLQVPLDFAVENSARVVSYEPKVVTVQLKGDDALMRLAEQQRVHARLDLSDLEPGDHRIPLRRSDVMSVPQGVSVDLLTRQIEVRLESVDQRTLPVSVTTRGRPPDGFSVISTRSLPPRVHAIGPRSTLESVPEVSTEPIDLRGRRAPFDVEVELVPPEDVDLEPARVVVAFDVQGVRQSRRVELPVRIAQPGFVAQTAVVRAVIEAPAGMLPDAVNAATVELSWSGAAPNGPLPVTVTFPGLDPDVREQVRVLQLIPAEVSVARSP